MAGMPIRRARRQALMQKLKDEAMALARQELGLPVVSGAPAPVPAALPPVKAPASPRGDDLLAQAPPEQLAELVKLALERAKEILSVKLDPYSADYPKLASIQQSTLTAVLATQARTDPGKLRGQTGDWTGDLLERIRSEETAEGTPLQ